MGADKVATPVMVRDSDPVASMPHSREHHFKMVDVEPLRIFTCLSGAEVMARPVE